MKVEFTQCKLIEYDMVKANISVLYQNGLIDHKTYSDLYDADKDVRNKTIGIMIRDGKLKYDVLSKLIDEYVDMFLTVNGLTDHVVERCRDALWVKNIYAHTTSFGDYVKFTAKNVATSYMVIDKVKIYYNSDSGELFTRGLGKKTFPFVEHVVKRVMTLKEFNNYKDLYVYIHNLNIKYMDETVNKDMTIKFTPYENSEIIEKFILELL